MFSVKSLLVHSRFVGVGCPALLTLAELGGDVAWREPPWRETSLRVLRRNGEGVEVHAGSTMHCSMRPPISAVPFGRSLCVLSERFKGTADIGGLIEPRVCLSFIRNGTMFETWKSVCLGRRMVA